MIKFVLFTRGRTGSTAVLDEINNLDTVVALQEPFLTGFSSSDTLFPGNPQLLRYENYLEQSNLWTKFTAKTLENYSLTKYLGKLTSAAMRQDKEAIGIKLLSHHASQHPSLISVLKREGFRFIYLQRNPVRQVISGMVASERKIYNSKQDVDDAVPLKLDAKVFSDKLYGELLRTSEDIILLRSLDLPVIELRYEDFLENRSKFFLDLLHFLDLPPKLPPASDHKIMIKNIESTVINLDELYSIARTAYISL